MQNVFKRAWSRLQRDLSKGDPLTQIATKSARYAWELASSRIFLAGVNVVGDGVRTLHRPRIENRGFMSIGAHTLLRSVNVPVELATAPGARLEIGAECSLNYGVSFGCMQSIKVGNRCRFGPYAMVVDTAFHDLYDRAKRPPPEPVTIEDDVWIGAKASVMPGVTIGRGAVVATGAVVTKSVPPFSVVAGVPAKVVKELDPSKFVVHGQVVPDSE